MVKRLHVVQLVPMVLDHVKGIWSKLLFGLRSWFFDAWYYELERDKFFSMLGIWRELVLPNLKYKYEVFDCDDFARFFASWIGLRTNSNCCGIAIGLVKTPQGVFGHAWNVCVIDDDGEDRIVFVEPQIGWILNEDMTIMGVGERIRVRGRQTVSGPKLRYELKAVVW